MTSKLKCPVCPFCSGKLYCSDNSYSCLNDQCLFGDFFFVAKRWNAIIELKQALIQAKQDLENAKNGLHRVITKTNSQVVRGFEYIATGIVKVAKDTLKQIEHKE